MAPARELPDVACLHGLSQGHPKGVRTVAPLFLAWTMVYNREKQTRERKVYMTKIEKITVRAKEILASCPEGIRFSELVNRLQESFPGEPVGTLTGSIGNLVTRYPDEIYKPSKGLFRLTRFRTGGASPVSASPRQIGRVYEEIMCSLSETLKIVRAKISKLQGTNPGETTTKTALINPVLCALGWDVEDPEYVLMEDRGKVKKYNPPDYILLLDGKPKLVVEAKRLREKLDGDRRADALMGYVGAAAAGAEWIVLTNGDDYHIYNAFAQVSSFGQRLFRAVQLSDPNSPAEKTLALLSKERIYGLKAEWDTQWADRLVRKAIETLFLPDSHSHLINFIKKNVEGLAPKEIMASLSRVCPQFKFHLNGISPPEPPPPPPPKKPGETKEDEYRQFWEPIRHEGLFAGKSADGRWISKRFQGICLSLVVHNHECRVDLEFQREDRAQRRDKAVNLLPALKNNCKFHDTPKVALVRFPVLDKGIKDRGDWAEIQKKLTKLGEDIYNTLSNSDI